MLRSSQIEMLVDEGVFDENRFPRDLVMAEDWVGNVDFDLLNEMKESWGSGSQADRDAYKVQPAVEGQLNAAWKKTDGGWAGHEGGEVYGGKDSEDEKEIYLEKFREWFEINGGEPL